MTKKQEVGFATEIPHIETDTESRLFRATSLFDLTFAEPIRCRAKVRSKYILRPKWSDFDL